MARPALAVQLPVAAPQWARSGRRLSPDVVQLLLLPPPPQLRAKNGRRGRLLCQARLSEHSVSEHSVSEQSATADTSLINAAPYRGKKMQSSPCMHPRFARDDARTTNMRAPWASMPAIACLIGEKVGCAVAKCPNSVHP